VCVVARNTRVLVVFFLVMSFTIQNICMCSLRNVHYDVSTKVLLVTDEESEQHKVGWCRCVNVLRETKLLHILFS
jgi:hypothetical protein